MERFSELLLKVWRQVSCHVRVEESVPLIAPLLWERLPADALGVLRIELSHRRLDAIAVSRTPAVATALPRQHELAEKELEDLLAWGRSDSVLRASSPIVDRHMLGLLHGTGGGDLLAVPLADQAGVHGAFLAVAERAGAFDAEHEILARALREPLTVALENDERVAEISALRDAAEADKVSLLRRLGRDAIVDAIVGAESGLKTVMERVDLVAPSDLPVLILGETGSGKEVIARAIHQRSPRRDGPFLRVNCGAIPSELIDSELFGHEKGSFTGATSLREGWFERAHGGSLFLDEVGELSPGAQVRLLRVLQDGTFERVGGQRSLTVDVRVVAATHPDLQGKVADGRFRQDLWYRIAVFPIELPPLRARPEDIPQMANHFAQRSARRFGYRAQQVSPEDLRLLLGYAWPGNARELAAVIDRAVILGRGRRLEVAKGLGMPLGPAMANGRGDAGTDPGNRTPQSSRLDDVVREHIERVLAATQGRIEGPRGTANVLDVNPHTLRSRMRRLGIDWQKFRPGP
ncbi:MAG: sigma-54 dependent transcriptional regulator [Phycisphaerae bacterium]|jgi:transcriptional regulator with GAF, ATPase, and Fis domain